MNSGMKFGILDSGLGGLWVLRHIRAVLPDIDYVFFGDQVHVPYGEKTTLELFGYSTEIISYLYEKENCAVVLLACNTTSSSIFSKLKTWQEEKYPDRFLLSIIEPTVQAVPGDLPVALFGTRRTIGSEVYQTELTKKGQEVFAIALPELCTLIESGKDTENYISRFTLPQKEMNAVLVCTHYGIVKDVFVEIFPQVTHLICQEDFLPEFIKNFLDKNEELEASLSKDRTIKILVSAQSEVFDQWLRTWFGDVGREVVRSNSML